MVPAAPRWQNWAGNQAAAPQRVSHARAPPRRSPRRSPLAARDGLTVRMTGSGHSVHPGRRDRAACCCSPDGLRAIRSVDAAAGAGHGRGGLPAAGAQRAPVRPRAWPWPTWATSRSRPSPGRSRPAPTAPAGTCGGIAAQVAGARAGPRRRQHRDLLARTSAAELFDAARIGLGRARRAHRGDLPDGARVPAHRARGADAAGPRSSPGWTSWPAANEHFEFYWFPHTDGCLTKRNNRVAGPPRPLPPVAVPARRRVPVQLGVRGHLPARPRAARGRSRPSTASPAGRSARGPTPTPRTGCSPARAGCGSRSRSTRSRGEHLAEALAASCGAVRPARLADQLPDRGAGRRRPTTSGCPPRTAGTPPTSPSTCSTPRRTRSTSARSRRCMTAARRAPALGQAAHP